MGEPQPSRISRASVKTQWGDAMKHPDPEEMDDGVRDHRGEALPYSSKSAKNMKMDKLLSTPMPKFDGITSSVHTSGQEHLLDL